MAPLTSQISSTFLRCSFFPSFHAVNLRFSFYLLFPFSFFLFIFILVSRSDFTYLSTFFHLFIIFPPRIFPLYLFQSHLIQHCLRFLFIYYFIISCFFFFFVSRLRYPLIYSSFLALTHSFIQLFIFLFSPCFVIYPTLQFLSFCIFVTHSFLLPLSLKIFIQLFIFLFSLLRN